MKNWRVMMARIVDVEELLERTVERRRRRWTDASLETCVRVNSRAERGEKSDRTWVHSDVCSLLLNQRALNFPSRTTRSWLAIWLLKSWPRNRMRRPEWFVRIPTPASQRIQSRVILKRLPFRCVWCDVQTGRPMWFGWISAQAGIKTAEML